MTTHGMALKAFRQAEYRLQLVQKALADSEWATVVRESQEVVELALKALLRYLGVEPPRWHDVTGVLRAESARLPVVLAGDLDRLCAISASLRADRELSFYGDETRQLAPDDLYGEADARPAAESARFVVERVGTALGRLTEGKE